MRIPILLLMLSSQCVLSQAAEENRGVEIYHPRILSENAPPHRTLDWIAVNRSRSDIPTDPKKHPGFLLANQHCIRCHLVPEPDQIPREAWPFVLTWMANYVGYENRYGYFEGIVLDSPKLDEPAISEADLRLLSEYFQIYAPTESDIRALVPVPQETMTQFETIPFKTNIPDASTVTLVDFDQTKKRYLFGWANERALQSYGPDGRLYFDERFYSEPVDVEIRGDEYLVSLMGHFLSDRKMGQVINLGWNDAGLSVTNAVVSDYHRLVKTELTDLDEDHIDDMILVGFGDGDKGQVSIRWGSSDGLFGDETVLLDYSGAVDVDVSDIDRDGRQDLIVLTSQNQQELLLFRNEGSRDQWSKRIVYKKFAGFGMTHCALMDFNGDGLLDLVLSNGNNMEIERAPLKGYQGVRILEQTKEMKFEERYFYPLFGAWKSIPEDFDGDGDVDIAVIAYNPDWGSPVPSTFVYLENRGTSYEFNPTVPSTKHWGRWITMKKADVDYDGDQDLILGGGYYPLGIDSGLMQRYSQLVKGRPSVMVLKNTHNVKSRP